MIRRKLLQLFAFAPFAALAASVKSQQIGHAAIQEMADRWKLPVGVNWYEIGGQKLYPIIDDNHERTGRFVAYLWAGDKGLFRKEFDSGRLGQANSETGMSLTFPKRKFVTACFEGGMPLGSQRPKGAILTIEFEKDESVHSARKRLKLAIEIVSQYA